MIISKQRLVKLSFALNVILISLSAFFAAKRYRFQEELTHPKSFPSYLSNPQYAEQLNIEPAYTRPVKIIMLGNSHVYKAHWDELLNRGDIGNRGIGSDITEGFLHRLEYVFSAHPAICFIEGGANDIWAHIPADTIVRNLSILIDTLRANNIIPVLHTLSPFSAQEQRSSELNPIVIGLNKKIKNMAGENKVDCIDLYDLFAEKGVLAPSYSQPDGTHFTAIAYVKWKEAIQSILKKYGI